MQARRGSVRSIIVGILALGVLAGVIYQVNRFSSGSDTIAATKRFDQLSGEVGMLSSRTPDKIPIHRERVELARKYFDEEDSRYFNAYFGLLRALVDADMHQEARGVLPEVERIAMLHMSETDYRFKDFQEIRRTLADSGR